MNALLTTKIMTFVSILFMSCVGFGEAVTSPGVTVNGSDPAVAEALMKNQARQECTAAIRQAKSSYSKAFAACRSYEGGKSIESCSKTMNDCEDNLDDENPIMTSMTSYNPMMSQFFSLEGGSKNSCSDYGRTEYNSEEKDYKRDKEQTAKALVDAQRQIAKDQEEYAKTSASIKEKINEAKAEKVKSDLEYKEAQRQQDDEDKKALLEINKNIRDTQGSILRAQQEKLLKISARTLEIDGYRIKLLDCKMTVQKMVDDNAKIKKSAAGGINALASSSRSKNSDYEAVWESCVNKVLNERKTKGQAYDNEIELLDNAISDLTKTLVELTASKTEMEKRIEQAKTDRNEAKKQKDIADQENYANLLAEAADAEKVANQKIAQTRQEIQNAQMTATQSSNDLVNFQKNRPVGKNSLSENSASVMAYMGDVEACKDACNATTLGKGEADRSSSCSQTTGTGPRNSGDTGRGSAATGRP